MFHLPQGAPLKFFWPLRGGAFFSRSVVSAAWGGKVKF
jgi:hypothetical protein